MPDNRILEHLAAHGNHHLARHLKPVTLTRGDSIFTTGRRISHVYFCVDAVISIRAGAEPPNTLEIGQVGREGMAGLSAVLADGYSPYDAEVQFGGQALRMRAPLLKTEFERNAPLREALLHYTHHFIAQLAQNAACHGTHQLEARLARWLLHAQDARGLGALDVTQSYLADLLGVQRPGVCMAVSSLESAGAIEHGRGFVRIRDRKLLEAASCPCYRILTHRRTRAASRA